MSNDRNEKSDNSLVTAKIGLWSAVAVALIGAVTSVAVVTVDKVIAPRVTSQEVEETVRANAPSFMFFDEIRTDRVTRQALPGNWQICTLATAGTVHHNQACTCSIRRDDNTDWFLDVLLDENVPGSDCKCRAACFDFDPAQ